VVARVPDPGRERNLPGMIGILIVDDHEGFRAQARMLLEASGYNVVGEAADAESAVEAVVELDPDVVLLDVLLPDHDGFWVAEHVEKEEQRPRIIMISSRQARDYGSLLTKVPDLGFIHKPELSRSRLEEVLGAAT
jgi:DNA-binding NarL/FixJ family response regulator